jgi:hypothetical protein
MKKTEMEASSPLQLQMKAAGVPIVKYSDDQPRDEKGRFGSTGSGSSRFEAKFTGNDYMVADHQTHQQYPAEGAQQAEQHASELNTLHESGKSDEAGQKHAEHSLHAWNKRYAQERRSARRRGL